MVRQSDFKAVTCEKSVYLSLDEIWKAVPIVLLFIYFLFLFFSIYFY